MNSFHQKFNRHGQSVLEYCVILTLVMAGIIIMRPYVVRSWNAQMKGWEDSVEDSQKDKLAQSNDRVLLQGCNCRWETVGCGNLNRSETQSNPPNTCYIGQLTRRHVCTDTKCLKRCKETCNKLPSGHLDSACESHCNYLYSTKIECAWSEGCCDEWSPLDPTLPDRQECGAAAGCPDIINPVTGEKTCQMHQTSTCGENTPVTRCFTPRNNNCCFQCGPPAGLEIGLANTAFPNNYCPGYNVGLTANTPWKYINHASDPTDPIPNACSGGKCRVICCPGYCAINCGDGFCSQGETRTNCPQDCP